MKTIEFTPEEVQFVLNILAQISIKPSAPDAGQVVKIVQELTLKLS